MIALQNRTPSPSPKPRPISRRAVMTGLTLGLVLCGITPYNDYYVAATYLGGNFFPVGAIAAVLLLVLAINPLLIARGRRNKIFTPAEIVTVWSLITVVSGIPSSGLMRYLIPHIVAPHYYATPENGWETTIISKMPPYLILSDPNAVKAFFEGLSRHQAIPWAAWFVPLVWWGIFVAMLFGVFFCLTAILRKQWVETERLSFPLVRLPALLAESPEDGYRFNSLLRNPLVWRAVILVTIIHTVKGLHLFFPKVPDIPMAWDGGAYFTVGPLSGIGSHTFSIYPLVIGFAYFIASDVCLSLWLFYVLFKIQCMVGSMHAWDMSTTQGIWGYCMGPTFVSHEEAGGALALVIWLLFSMRGHLANVWRKAVSNAGDVDDSQEPLSYRAAVFGLGGCYLGLFVWLTLVARLTPTLSAAILGGSFVVFVMLSWLVVQGGLLFVQHSFSAVEMSTVFGGSHVAPAGLLATGMTVEHIGWQDAREFMAPSLLNAYKSISDTPVSSRTLSRYLGMAVALAVLISGIVSIWLPYSHGGALQLHNHWMYTGAPQNVYTWSSEEGRTFTSFSKDDCLHFAGGAVLVFSLFLCRSWFTWFQIHPAGFLTAGTWAMYTLWFSLFLGWMCKSIILRYGGTKIYRTLMPLFLGLIIGDCLNAVVWAIVGLITHQGYVLLPG